MSDLPKANLRQYRPFCGNRKCLPPDCRLRPRLVFARRPQRVLYFYFLDPQFGLVHVRLQTWFPFTIQVYVNGVPGADFLRPEGRAIACQGAG
ncbi:MAG: hypothetical protein AB7K24_31860 [Gemmataceae bacterium]